MRTRLSPVFPHAGIALFLSGQTSFQLNVTSAGPIPISGLAKPLFGQQAGSNALASILTAEENNLFAKEYEVIVNRSTAAQATLATAMLPAGPGGVANPPQYLDPITNKLVNNNFATSLADRGAHHRRAQWAWSQPSDLLRDAGRL